MSRSLQSRLLITSAVATATALLSSHFAMYVLVGEVLRADFDRGLEARARTIGALIERDGDKLEIELESHPLPEFERSERPEYYEVYGSNGRPVLQSARLPESGLGNTLLGARPLQLPDGRHGRSVAIQFVPHAEDHDAPPSESNGDAFVTLALARDTRELQDALTRLSWVMTAGALVATVLAVVLVLLVVRSGLKAVPELGAKIAAIDPQRLNARVDGTGVPAEFDPVVTCINRLLARVETAFERERRFTSDVAHELRTPLAGLRSTLEVTLTQTRSSEEYQRALTECLTISTQTQALAERLLLLARADANQLVARRETFRLSDILDESSRSLSRHAESRGVSVAWQVATDLTVTTDSQLLQVVVKNLLSNAISHGSANGVVDVSAGRRGNAVCLEIANSGSQLQPEQMSHLFDRFWRGDTARNNTGEHAGLGLSLCQALLTSLGGQITISGSADGRFLAVVHLPDVPQDTLGRKSDRDREPLIRAGL